MGRIYQFLIKNFGFNFFEFTDYDSIIINNSVFFKKYFNFKNLFFLKSINLKKINLCKHSVNVIYF